MKYAWISGTSSGLGKALAEQLLEKGWGVTGISRNQTIAHANYHHVFLDLSQPGAPELVHFDPGVAGEVLLINNAGTIGEMKWIGQINDQSIEKGLYLNLIAPAILLNRFIADTENFQGKRTVLNISSGASQNAYDGWSIYCSSKAGLDMLTETAVMERMLAGDERTRIFSIAPGILDTAMQEKIRQADKNNFSKLDKFAELHAEGKLIDPDQAATRLLEIINRSIEFPATRYDLRDL